MVSALVKLNSTVPFPPSRTSKPKSFTKGSPDSSLPLVAPVSILSKPKVNAWAELAFKTVKPKPKLRVASANLETILFAMFLICLFREEIINTLFT